MFGESAVGVDKYVRSMQISAVVDHEFARLKPEHRSIIDSYAAGINAYVQTIGALPLEFQVLHAHFAPWKPKDSMMVFKLFSFELSSSHWRTTVLRSAVAKRLSKSWAEKLVPFEDSASFLDQQPTTVDLLPENVKARPSEPSKGAYRIPPKRPMPANPYENTRGTPKRVEPVKANKPVIPPSPSGSNTWAISGNFTDTHKPILASDPHFVRQLPGVFYLAAMETVGTKQSVSMSGATLVGVPAVMIGRNHAVAWGISASTIENVDVFKVKLSENRTHFQHFGLWKALTMHEETIKVKGREDIKYATYSTIHGPILDFPNLTDSNVKLFT